MTDFHTLPASESGSSMLASGFKGKMTISVVGRGGGGIFLGVCDDGNVRGFGLFVFLGGNWFGLVGVVRW